MGSTVGEIRERHGERVWNSSGWFDERGYAPHEDNPDAEQWLLDKLKISDANLWLEQQLISEYTSYRNNEGDQLQEIMGHHIQELMGVNNGRALLRAFRKHQRHYLMLDEYPANLD